MGKVVDFGTRQILDGGRDVVGEMMKEVYAKISAEPISPDLLQFCLDQMPTGNYDDSTMN